MYCNAKNIENYLVLSKESAIFALPSRAKSYRQARYISKSAYKAGSLRQSYFGMIARFGDFQKELAPFVIYIINLLYLECQTVTKALMQGIIVPAPHQHLLSLSATFPRSLYRIFPSRTSRRRSSSPSMAKMPAPATARHPSNGCSRPGIRTWRSAKRSPNSGKTTFCIA